MRVWFGGLATAAAGEGVTVAIWAFADADGTAGVVVDALAGDGRVRAFYDVEVAPQ